VSRLEQKNLEKSRENGNDRYNDATIGTEVSLLASRVERLCSLNSADAEASRFLYEICWVKTGAFEEKDSKDEKDGKHDRLIYLCGAFSGS
jgi:hypothetical protein